MESVERILNLFNSSVKSDKKEALSGIRDLIDDTEQLAKLYEKLQNRLILACQDQNEFVREGVLEIIRTFLIKLDPDKSYLSRIIPGLYPRICREKDPESSEEIRLLITETLTLIVQKYDNDVAPYTTEFADIAVTLLLDSSPEVKRATSSLVIELVKTVPQQMYPFTKKLYPPLIKNMNHQQWKVRIASVEALNWVMLKGDNKCVADVTNPLSLKMFDPSVRVRMAVLKTIGRWSVDMVDRYSYFYHFIPIILTCMSDEDDDIVATAKTIWEETGEKYLKENQTEHFDKINYLPERLEHYPKGIERPSLGCRLLMDREAGKFLLALASELTSWNEQVRIKSSLLLAQVTLHFEFSLTQGIGKVIMQICRAAMDRETPQVRANVKLAMEYMGYFIPPETYTELIVDFMKEATEGELLVVAALIRGSQAEQLVPYLSNVATLLSHNSFKPAEQSALLNLIASIMSVCSSDSLCIGSHLFSSIVSTCGIAGSEQIRSESLELLDQLVQLGGGDKRTVYNNYCKDLLQALPNSTWSLHCKEQFIVSALLQYAPEVLFDNLEAVMIILKSALDASSDPEVVLKVTMAINYHMSSSDCWSNDKALQGFIKCVIEELIPTHLKWKPGRSAEALRTVAVTCLYMCLSKITKEMEMKTPVQRLFPDILSLLGDPAQKTRILCLKSVELIANRENPTIDNCEDLDKFITHTIKRLDDADPQVRYLSVPVIKTLYACPTIKQHCNKSLLEFVYTTLLIHLDDKDDSLREITLDVLKSITPLGPSTLRKKIFREHFRDVDKCDQLTQHIEEYLKISTESNDD